MTSIRVPLARLYPDPGNRPDGSGAGDVEAMAQTIRILGILQPPLVEPIPGRNGDFRIKDGHLRYAAAELAGLTEIDVEVRRFGHQLPEVTGALTAIITTLHRSPHGAVEMALKFGELAKAGMTANEIIRVTALPPSTVYGYLKLAKADRKTLEAARRGQLSIGAVKDAVTTAATMTPGDAPAPLRRPRRTGTAPPKPPAYFGAGHRLALPAAAECHRQHPRLPAAAKLPGKVACGPCWERVIRDDVRDAGGLPLPGPPPHGPGAEDRWTDPSVICGPVFRSGS